MLIGGSQTAGHSGPARPSRVSCWARARLADLCAEGGVPGVVEAGRAARQRGESERSREEATGTISRDLRDLTLDVMAQKIAGLSGRINAYAAERPS